MKQFDEEDFSKLVDKLEKVELSLTPKESYYLFGLLVQTQMIMAMGKECGIRQQDFEEATACRDNSRFIEELLRKISKQVYKQIKPELDL